jgi:hypothetical protein
MWLYALFLLLLLVVVVSLAVDRSRARQRFTAMSLQALQQQDNIPKWALIQAEVGGTDISSEYMVWFEVLLKRTFEESADWEHDYAFLAQKWAATLESVQANYTKAADLFSSEVGGPLHGAGQVNRLHCLERARTDDRWFFESLGKSFNWLGQVASTQQRLMSTRPAGLRRSQWNPDMFKWGPLNFSAKEWFETATSPEDIANEATRIVAEIGSGAKRE